MRRRGTVSRALRAAAVPVGCCVLALLGLTAWSGSGHAVRPSRITVSEGSIYRPPTGTETTTAAFFRIDNTGSAGDTLTRVSSTATGPAMLTRNVTAHHAGTMIMGDAVSVPAHSSTRLSASGQDVMVNLRRPLRIGQRIPFVLHFTYAGDVGADAVVVPIGS
jgi:copper(I)-binding protein